MPGYAAAIIPPGWTLPYELYFYIVFAAILVLPKRAALVSLTLLFVAAVLLGAVSPDLGAFFELATNAQLLIFVSGVWIAHLLGPQTRGGPGWSRLPASAPLAISLMGFVAAPALNGYGLPMVVTLGLPSIFMVAACVIAETRASAPRVISALAWLGESSYALYLIHSLVLWHGVRWFGPPPADNSTLFLRFALLAFLSVVASILLHVAVERPVMRWIKKSGLTRRRFLPRDEAVSQSSSQ